MKVTEIPIKQNANPVTDPNTQVSAEEFNAIVSETVDLKSSIGELVGGEIISSITLDDIGIRRQGYYINMLDGIQYSSPTAVITNAIYLSVGDIIILYTGGSGLAAIAMSFDKPNNSTVYEVIKKADNITEPISYTVKEDGYYSFSGRDSSQGESALTVNIRKKIFADGIIPEMKNKIDLLYDGGVKKIEYSLEDLSGDGAMIDRYINYDRLITLGSTNTIVTKPVYLYAGDKVRCSTGGTGICVFAESSTGTIISETTFTPMTDGSTSFDGTIEHNGWYVFSGRTNRTDGTNLQVNIESTTRSDNVFELLDKKANKSELARLSSVRASSGFALSVGANSVISEIQSSPWFDSVDNDGTTYGTYLDDKIDSVPEGDSFIFISDVHYAGNRKQSAKLIDYVRRRLGIKTIIHGGDVINEAPTVAEAAKEWLDFNRDFALRLGGDFKQVCGDHDHNGKYESTGQTLSYRFIQHAMNGYNINELNVDTVYDEQIKSISSANGWTDDELKEYEAWKKMHYFFDDASINTRFIVLHTGWTGNVGLAVDKIGSGALSETNALYLQMDFLYSSLINCPEGYNVVVVGHNIVTNVKYSVPSNGNTVARYNVNELVWIGQWESVAKMLNALKKKSSVQVGYRDWNGGAVKAKTYDFRNAPTPGTVLCIGGDVHWDILAKTTENTELSVLTEATLNNIIVTEGTILRSDILHALTMTDGGDRGYRAIVAPPSDSYNDTLDSALTANPNTAGTLDSQAFDIITITSNAIHFTRIGSGSDRVVYIE